VQIFPIMTSSQLRTERQLDVLLAQPGNSKPTPLTAQLDLTLHRPMRRLPRPGPTLGKHQPRHLPLRPMRLHPPFPRHTHIPR
jgi:hypothetical protein